MLSTPSLVILSAILTFSSANPEPKPPVAPPLDNNVMGSLNYTPDQVINTATAAISAVESAMFSQYPFPARPDPASSSIGTIQILGGDANIAAWFAPEPREGDPVWSNATAPAGVILPATTCSQLPKQFAMYGILNEWVAYPYVGISTFTAVPGAETTLNPNGAGYGFITPSNQTAARTFASGSGSFGTPFGSESTIWSLDCQTQQLSASWTQQDGRLAPLTFARWTPDRLGTIIATANYNAFKTRFPLTGKPLTFNYVPNSSENGVGFYDAKDKGVVDKVVGGVKDKVVNPINDNLIVPIKERLTGLKVGLVAADNNSTRTAEKIAQPFGDKPQQQIKRHVKRSFGHAGNAGHA